MQIHTNQAKQLEKIAVHLFRICNEWKMAEHLLWADRLVREIYRFILF